MMLSPIKKQAGLAAMAMLLVTPCKRYLKVDHIKVNADRREKLFQNMESYQHLDMDSKCLCCDVFAEDSDCGCMV